VGLGPWLRPALLTATYLVRSFALVGYSMGGNLVLKLAGERGATVPPYLKAVVGVSPVSSSRLPGDV
jgi:predicted alpha/beta-fold hydrolase